MRTMLSRITGLFRQPRRDAALDDEVRAHLDLLAADYERRGCSPEEARFAARRAFGGVESMKERYRDRRGWPMMSALARDIRHGCRALARSPSFSVPVVLSLTLAIGANVAAFSVVNTVVLRRLPVHDPDRLFYITYIGSSGTAEGGNYTWFELVRDRTRSISSAFISHRRGNMKVITAGGIEAVSGLQVSGGYFSGLGLSPQIGRLIEAADDQSASPARVAVLSDDYWTRRFARDPLVLGQTIRVDDVPHTVIGVTAPGFFGVEVGRRADVTVPIDPSEYRRGWVTMALIVRLPSNVSSEAANGELTTLFREFAGSLGGPLRNRFVDQHIQLAPMATGVSTPGTTRDRLGEPAVIVSVIIGLTLLLASTNWAMLLLARAAARRREVAVRLALGSTRGQVARQIVVESLSLAAIAGVMGLWLASWSVAYLPGNGLPRDLTIETDLRVLVFALALALGTAMLFSLAPIWLTRRVNVDELRAAARTQDRTGVRIGRVLVGAQIAMSVVIVVAAAFFGATLRNLRGQQMGFAGTGVVTFSLDADGTGVEGEALRALHRRILERLKGMPGVRSATLASVSPLSGNEDGKGITVPGFTPRTEGDLIVNVNTVGPEYFSTFGISVLRGRPITAGDTEASPHVALISESAANYYFAGQDPIGRRLEIRGATKLNPEIVGVVPDVMYDDLRSGADRMVYVPFAQRPAEGEYVFAVRTEAGREPFVLRDIPSGVNATAPNMPVLDLRTASRDIDLRTANERLLATISGILGGLALMLAGIGIYGIVTYTVRRRTPELGVRIALGAGHRHVLWTVARETLTVVVAAVALGTFLAVQASDLLTDILFGLTPGDPRVFAAGVAILFSTAVIAAARPVFRASQIHPVDVLRSE